MMKEVNRLLQFSMVAAEALLEKDGKMPSTYNGYIASFGAAIKQCGLPVTVAMYARADRSELDKRKLLEVISKIVNEKFDAATHHDSLLNFYKNFPPDKIYPNGNPLMQYRVELAAVALKLAIRTFPIKEKES